MRLSLASARPAASRLAAAALVALLPAVPGCSRTGDQARAEPVAQPSTLTPPSSAAARPTADQTVETAAAGSAAHAPPGPTVEDGEWPVVEPASQGIAGDRLARGVERVGGLRGARSLLVVRHGRIVAEQSFVGSGLTRQATDIKSASKTLLSALVGIAIERGELSGVQASVAELLPERAAALPAAKRSITLDQLLSMRSGLASTSGEHYGRWVASRDWTSAALARPLEGEPGTGFRYSTGSSHLVSAILSEATGGGVRAYAERHLLGPIGAATASWAGSPEGYDFGGNSVQLTPRDLARFGHLYLRGGRWGERPILPPEWVRTSTQRHAEGWPDRYGAYGYLWWLPVGDSWDSFAAVGYGGQFLYVVPQLDMLLVMTSTLESKGADWDREAFAIFREDLFGAAR